jgi:hypothetical protein
MIAKALGVKFTDLFQEVDITKAWSWFFAGKDWPNVPVWFIDRK